MLDDLILVRLLPAARPPSVPQVARDLAPMFRRPPDVERVREAIVELRGEGAVSSTGLAPTEAGRARALRFLGMEALPARWTWRTLKARALPARVLGLSPAEGGRVLASEDRLAGRLLQQRFALPEAAGADVWAALQALVCRDLGYGDCSTLEELAAAVLSRRMDVERPLPLPTVRKQAPRVLLDVPGGIDALRERVLTGWADAPSLAPASAGGRAPELAVVSFPPVPPRTPMPAPPRAGPDAEGLAGEILAAARACVTGRFGRDKVLVHHVWRTMSGRPSTTLPGDLDGFKRLLVTLNGAGRVALARADLVQLMDPDELARAEIRVGHATFHFVRAGAAP